MGSPDTENATPPDAEPDSSGRWVMLAVIVVVLGFSIAAWRAYDLSENYLIRAQTEMTTVGGKVDAPGCALAAVQSYRGCEAMKSLCEASVPRQVVTCLTVADRSAYCATIPHAGDTTAFGFQECERAGLNVRQTKKVCGIAFETLADWCHASHKPSRT